MLLGRSLTTVGNKTRVAAVGFSSAGHLGAGVERLTLRAHQYRWLVLPTHLKATTVDSRGLLQHGKAEQVPLDDDRSQQLRWTNLWQ